MGIEILYFQCTVLLFSLFLWKSASKVKPKVGFIYIKYLVLLSLGKLVNERKQVYAAHCGYCMGA